jgi:nitrogen PTS system EIIA component
MNRISRLITPSSIVLNHATTSKKRLFENLGLLFENNHLVEKGKVFDSLFARERLGSTGLGSGVAVPHGRIKGLKQPLAAIVRLTTALAFDSSDGLPVSLVVCLLVPEAATEEHLEILSEVAELLSDESMRAMLLDSADPVQLHAALNQWAPYRPQAPSIASGLA